MPHNHPTQPPTACSSLQQGTTEAQSLAPVIVVRSCHPPASGTAWDAAEPDTIGHFYQRRSGYSETMFLSKLLFENFWFNATSHFPFRNEQDSAFLIGHSFAIYLCGSCGGQIITLGQTLTAKALGISSFGKASPGLKAPLRRGAPGSR